VPDPATAATAAWHYDDETHLAWGVVAGLTVGQDISDGHLQSAAVGQLSPGKSGRAYAPTGPWVVMPDELADPDYLVISCAVDGEKVPEAWTGNLIFSVPSSSPSCAPCSRSARRCHLTSTSRASAPLASHPGSSSPAKS
jgi:hypothetical protein